MTNKKYLLVIILSLIFSTNFSYSEFSNNCELLPAEETENSGWQKYYNEMLVIRFPTNPTVTLFDEVIQYTAADITGFPISVYTLTIFRPTDGIDIEKFATDLLESEAGKGSIVWSEALEIENGIIFDLICSEKNKYLMRKERIIITSKETVVLTTVFFTLGFDNHDYFVDSFENLL